MTIDEAIGWVDTKKHNVYSREDKLVWLSQVEGMAAELMTRHGCTWEAPEEDTLSIPAPFDQLYLRWMEAQIDYTNQEYLKYNNAMAVFNALWLEYAKQVCRNHPAPARVFQIGG